MRGRSQDGAASWPRLASRDLRVSFVSSSCQSARGSLWAELPALVWTSVGDGIPLLPGLASQTQVRLRRSPAGPYTCFKATIYLATVCSCAEYAQVYIKTMYT